MIESHAKPSGQISASYSLSVLSPWLGLNQWLVRSVGGNNVTYLHRKQGIRAGQLLQVPSAAQGLSYPLPFPTVVGRRLQLAISSSLQRRWEWCISVLGCPSPPLIWWNLGSSDVCARICPRRIEIAIALPCLRLVRFLTRVCPGKNSMRELTLLFVI